MVSWLTALAVAFGAVFLLELPDKTTALTLVLTTRFRALPVVVGCAVAFALQATIAVTVGSAITLLPERMVAITVAVLFAIGAFMLLREGFANGHTDAAGQAAAIRPQATFPRAAITSFGTIFAAEWGDASQLTAAGVAARYAEPLAVGLGSWLALVSVTLLAVAIGGRIRERVPAHWVHRGAGFVFAGFAAAAALQAATG
ncbi:UPF0016 family membrane protein [Longimycelium tulufanense]|uniref:GDT1 family protein n=1 Tax=Longimycelium tulufanense TaxID=907463 RepID=A0A8J3CHH9_9PSEU|nr:TMEM165/GDT1 family protein [Longimycelium tulufanense]GGM76120.1 UPF0016 family membrane protein [Longimycelium tulufanense]